MITRQYHQSLNLYISYAEGLCYTDIERLRFTKFYQKYLSTILA